mmetsp:Transcript_5898/g.23899  ORF Transcript_5898/g.23899 Transcript_5898/m.23899 type:complete len:359 (+) Transcript_5898:1088-2164(+)
MERARRRATRGERWWYRRRTAGDFATARSLAFAFGSRVEVEPRAREKKMRKKSTDAPSSSRRARHTLCGEDGARRHGEVRGRRRLLAGVLHRLHRVPHALDLRRGVRDGQLRLQRRHEGVPGDERGIHRGRGARLGRRRRRHRHNLRGGECRGHRVHGHTVERGVGHGRELRELLLQLHTRQERCVVGKGARAAHAPLAVGGARRGVRLGVCALGAGVVLRLAVALPALHLQAGSDELLEAHHRVVLGPGLGDGARLARVGRLARGRRRVAFAQPPPLRRRRGGRRADARARREHAAQRAVETVLHLVIRPAGDASGDDRPLVAVHGVRGEDFLVLLLGERPALHRGVELVAPPARKE